VDKKPNQRNKRIDPVDAVIDAHALMLLNKNEMKVDVENELEDYLKMMGWR
jgi:phage terminase large subunit-like protein